MDEIRRIRFIVAPLLFLASLAWGIVRDPIVVVGDLLPGVELKLNDLYGLIAAIAGGGLALFPLGFLIGTITNVILRLVSEVLYLLGRGSGSYEACLSHASLEAVWRAVGMAGSLDRRDAFFAVVSFDYDVLAKGQPAVHQWLFRRSNAFNIAITSTTALLLSLCVGWLLGICWRNDWHWIVFGLCGFLLVAAWFAWRDTMKMLTFQVRRIRDRSGTSNGTNSG